MASEIHKKRTGKGFRITEEIVLKEEMYEEEEDDFPRSYRLLGPNMQTASAEMNARVETYLSNRVAMSALVARTNEDWARENEINRLFAQSFPNAGKQAQRLSQQFSSPILPSGSDKPSPSPTSPTFQSVDYQHGSGQHDRKRSRSGLSPSEARAAEALLSPTTLTPKSDPQTPQPRTTSVGGTLSSDMVSDGSVFTAELPAEAKMLLGGMDMNDVFNQNMYGQDWISSGYFNPLEVPRAAKLEDEPDLSYEMFGTSLSSPSKYDPLQTNEEPAWNTFLDENVWSTEQ